MRYQSTKILLLTYLSSTLWLCNGIKQIFIDYGIGSSLSGIFAEIHDGFYVDIGNDNNCFQTNTLNLYVMGWTGIYVNANIEQYSKCLLMRQEQIKFYFVIGMEDDQFVVIDERKNQGKQYQRMENKELSKVPQITLKSLCERYYYRKPNFMSISIYTQQILTTNNWNNDKCRPDILSISYSQQINQTQILMILTQIGYINISLNDSNKQIYIHKSVYHQYTNRYEKQIPIYQNKSRIKINDLLQIISNKLVNESTQYNEQQNNIYYHVSRYRQLINLNRINQQSNLVSWKQNRPIILLNFDYFTSGIILNNSKYASSIVRVGSYRFYNITVFKSDGTVYHCYFLDDFSLRGSKPKIIISPRIKQNQTNIPNINNIDSIIPLIQTHTSITKQLIQARQQKLTKLNTQILMIINTSLNNYKYNVQKLRNIYTRINYLQNNYQLRKYYGKSLLQYKDYQKIVIQDFNKKQFMILLVVFFFNSFGVIVVCFDKQSSNGEQRKQEDVESEIKLQIQKEM